MTQPAGPPSPLARALRWAGLALLSLLILALVRAVGLPAPLLLAPMLAGILVAVAGAGIAMPTLPFRFAQSIIGCMIASILTLPVLHEILADWPIFLAGVLSVVVIATLLGWTLARLEILPGTTAIWGSSPGAAGAMTLLSASFGADIRLVAFMQYTRVVIVATAAVLVARFWGDAGQAAPPRPDLLAPPDWPWLAATLLLCAGAVTLGRLLPIPASPLLLPLLLGVLLQDLGLLVIELPPLLLAAAYCIVGWGIGLRFTRDTVRQSARAFPAILLSIVCLVALCTGFAALLVAFADVDPLTAYLAMSPGGADTVAIIAASADVDVAFVMAMQTARLLFLLLTGPFIARLVAGHLARRHGQRG